MLIFKLFTNLRTSEPQNLSALHFAFIDIAASYNAETPYQQALGGTQSAVCYLGVELVKRGHKVTFINQQRGEGVFRGVENLPPEMLDDEAVIQQFEVLVLNGRWTEKIVKTLRSKTRAKLVGWMHEAVFNDPYILPCAEFDTFVFVSAWQKKINTPLISPSTKTFVISNGVAPGFVDVEVRDKKPIAVYAGSSKRGLLDLPEIIPALHVQHPALRFEIYSDCVVSQNAQDCENFKAQLRALPYVDWVGAVAQSELPQRFSRAMFFLSPNAYPETFCIALAEAMAAGCHPIITARAALPETAGGFATLIPIQNPDHSEWLRDGVDKKLFTEKASQAISEWMDMPEEICAEKIKKQIAFVKENYAWGKISEKWLFPSHTLIG